MILVASAGIKELYGLITFERPAMDSGMRLSRNVITRSPSSKVSQKISVMGISFGEVIAGGITKLTSRNSKPEVGCRKKRDLPPEREYERVLPCQ